LEKALSYPNLVGTVILRSIDFNTYLDTFFTSEKAETNRKRKRITYPDLRECFKQSINKKNEFFEREMHTWRKMVKMPSIPRKTRGKETYGIVNLAPKELLS
jgi:hypothetical protein